MGRLLVRWRLLCGLVLVQLCVVAGMYVVSDETLDAVARVELGADGQFVGSRELNNARYLALSDEVRPRSVDQRDLVAEIEEDTTILALHVEASDPTVAVSLAEQWRERFAAAWDTDESRSVLAAEFRDRSAEAGAVREQFEQRRDEISAAATDAAPAVRVSLQAEYLSLLTISGGDIRVAAEASDAWRGAASVLERSDGAPTIDVTEPVRLPVRRSLPRHLAFSGAVIALLSVLVTTAVDWRGDDR